MKTSASLFIAITSYQRLYFHECKVHYRPGHAKMISNPLLVVIDVAIAQGARFEKKVCALGSLHNGQDNIRCIQEFQRIQCPVPDCEMILDTIEKGARRAAMFSVVKDIYDGSKCREFGSDGYRQCSCAKSLDSRYIRSSLSLSGLLITQMGLLFLEQLLRSDLLFIGRSVVKNFLSPHGKGKRPNGKSSLRPCGPLALGYTESFHQPAAVIDRIRHVTSPVSDRAIVCGGHA